MADNNDTKQGGGMRTREQILADLRGAKIDLDCTIDEARATIAIETVEQIRDEIQRLRDEIGELAERLADDPRANFAEAFMSAWWQGMKETVTQVEAYISARKKKRG